jgi:hypothetical protein
MTFEALVTRLLSLHDVDQARAVDVANERLADMAAESKGIRAQISLGTTTSGTATYALAANIIQVYRATVAFTAGTVTYEATESIEALWDVVAGRAEAPPGEYFCAVEPDTDLLQTTDYLRLYPAPDESSKTITGVVAVAPATIVYASATALPIPLDCHKHLLAGCRAELLDEESRQDESAKLEAVYQQGIRRLSARQKARGSGSGHHRMRVRGYDF